MTDHSALIERLEVHDGSHDRGCDGRNYACTCGDDDKGEALLKEAAAALRDLTEWRDIATAPKDGDAILISLPTHFMDEEGWHVVRWEDDKWVCHDGKFDTPLRGPDPTHWLPLPPVTQGSLSVTNSRPA